MKGRAGGSLTKKLKINKLRLTPQAGAKLRQLGLSPDDVYLIATFARKQPREGSTLYTFEPSKLPVEVRAQLAYLRGASLHVSEGMIVNVTLERGSQCAETHNQQQPD
jgi:hypothetical protein